MMSWLLAGILALQGLGTPDAAPPPPGRLDAANPARSAQTDAASAAPSGDVAVASGPLEESYVRVARQLRCPVCQQLSILDSPADLAVEMRAVVRERLAAGESEEQVLAYFVSKYGQWVLLDPPKRGFNLVVWLGPLVLLVGGALVLAKVFAAWLRSPDREESATPEGSTPI